MQEFVFLTKAQMVLKLLDDHKWSSKVLDLLCKKIESPIFIAPAVGAVAP